MMSDNRNEIIRESIDEIEPAEAAESRMLSHIYSKAADQKKQENPAVRRGYFGNGKRWAMPFAACLLILAAVMILPNHIKGKGSPKEAMGTDGAIFSLANPYEAVEDASEFEKRLGISLDAPQNAENVVYSIINGELADIDFTLNGHEYKLRGSNQDGDISGLYGEEASSEVLEEGSNATMTILKSGQDTYITVSWEKDGVFFNLANVDGASAEEVSSVYELVK